MEKKNKIYNVSVKGSGTRDQIIDSLKKMVDSLEKIDQSYFALIDSHCLADDVVNFHISSDGDPRNKPLEFFRNDITARAYTILKHEVGAKTLNDVSKLSVRELYKHRNCGKYTVDSIVSLASKYGLSLAK